MDLNKESILLHKANKGKLEVISKVKINNKKDLSLLYTPGVGGVCLEIKKKPSLAKELTSSKNTVVVITDGSAVLGFGDIGVIPSLPVMEGKAALFKEFAGVDAFPITIDTRDVDSFVNTVKLISKTFGGINLEDISAPRCFEIEERLKKELDIPVFHDDQHGTAIIVLASLINAIKVVNKPRNLKIVVNGSGAAGISITKLLSDYGFSNILVCDSVGIISKNRTDLNKYKLDLLKITNKQNISGSLNDALNKADVFIGVSKGNLLTFQDIKRMNKDSIIFSLANPVPEIYPEEAIKGGAKIIATGRSDYPNQINNVLVFPGLFKALLKYDIKKVTENMQIDVGVAISKVVKKPTKDLIVPSVFDKKVIIEIDRAIKKYKK